MKAFKKVMDGLAMFEKIIVCVLLSIVSVITFANVLSRFVLHMSLSWSEELVVNVFVLLTMLGCALCARDGTLISLTLIFDRLSVGAKKVFVAITSVVSIIFYVMMFHSGFQKVLSQLASHKRTASMGVPEWIFTIFLPIGAVFLIIHTIEYFIDVMRGEAECVQLPAEKKEGGAAE